MTPFMIAIIIVVSLIFIGGVVALSMSGSTPQPSSVTPVTTNPVTTTPIGSSPTVTDPVPNTPVVVKNMGVWLRDPGGGYVNGLSYDGSKAYCVNRGGRLATKSEIDAAGAKLNFCAAGWYQGPDQGWYSNGQDIAGCGAAGWHTLTDAPVDKKLGTFCYGQIPADPLVVATAILS